MPVLPQVRLLPAWAGQRRLPVTGRVEVPEPGFFSRALVTGCTLFNRGRWDLGTLHRGRRGLGIFGLDATGSMSASAAVRSTVACSAVAWTASAWSATGAVASVRSAAVSSDF
ncbi:hypothetical protein AHiyo4_26090 [Arthrobacter sp. Hiyo4]|nr:hypothetical protein AHiyo4_26090 [Arthrobacter sp. Hiyo4]